MRDAHEGIVMLLRWYILLKEKHNTYFFSDINEARSRATEINNKNRPAGVVALLIEYREIERKDQSSTGSALMPLS